MAYLTIGALKRLSLYLAGQLASAVSITGGAISGVTLAATGAVLTTPAITGGTIASAALTSATLGLASGQVGTFTCNGATPVTVTNVAVTANSVIVVTLKTVGGTVGAIPAVKTITPTTGFTIAGTALDTSVYNYAIIG